MDLLVGAVGVDRRGEAGVVLVGEPLGRTTQHMVTTQLFHHPAARTVSMARGVATWPCCSVNTPHGRDGSTHSRVRLRHHTTVGRLKLGMSTSRTIRRPWELAPNHRRRRLDRDLNPAGIVVDTDHGGPGRPTCRSQRSQ